MEFLGFWNEETPVKSDKEDIYCTLYKSENRWIIAVASWNDKDCEVNLSVEGIDLSGCKIYAPEISYFQDYEEFNKLKFNIEQAKGKIIVIDK
jgi:hypothetical protein